MPMPITDKLIKYSGGCGNKGSRPFYITVVKILNLEPLHL